VALAGHHNSPLLRGCLPYRVVRADHQQTADAVAGKSLANQEAFILTPIGAFAT